MKDNDKFADILQICLERLKNGEPLDDILDDHPQHRDDLKAYLNLAASLEANPRPLIEDSARHKAFFRFAADSARVELKLEFLNRFRRTLAWAALFFIAIISAGYSAVSFAESSLPGQFFYPLKLTTEKIALSLTTSPEGRTELHIDLSEKRLHEIVTSIENGRQFDAVIEEMIRETSAALQQLEKLPDNRKEILLAKIQYACTFQSNVLENLVQNTGPDRRAELNEAIVLCRLTTDKCSEMREQCRYRNPSCELETHEADMPPCKGN
ncbi:MAG: hypothetical protein H8E46_00245 [FCB group bacterium]|nr:hypothetical protein [FCB group bacterium]